MRSLRFALLSLIVLSSIVLHPSDTPALTPAASRQAVMDTSWIYVTLKWTCHNTFTSTSRGNFFEGKQYIGEAYRYGGNDHWKDFLDKVEVQKLQPRQRAGIDCSAFVSRCWGLSRQTAFSLDDLSHVIPRDMLKSADILNDRDAHVVLVESLSTDYAVIVRESTGGQIARVVRRSTTWSRYNGYIPRTLVDLSADSAAVEEHAVGASAPGELRVRARIWNDGGVPISGVVGFYEDNPGSPIGVDTVRVDARRWGDVQVPWNVADLPAGEHTLLIRVDEASPVESDTTNNLTTMTYALPLTLSSLQAEVGEDRVHLRWITQEEQGNQGFHLYRAVAMESGPLSYRRITSGLVPGAGTTADQHTYEFVDTELIDDVSYVYALTATTTDGREIPYRTLSATPPQPALISDQVPSQPITYALRQNRPNPFNISTTIEYELLERVDVTLTIYDVLGRTIRMWRYRAQDAGRYRERWDGKDEEGKTVSSGIYLYHLTTDTFAEAKRMILLK